MPGRIDQIKVVHLPTARLICQRSGLRLDGDTALALDIHRIENLRLHLPVRQPAAEVNDSVRKSRFTMVDMSDDGKISNELQLHRTYRSGVAAPEKKGAGGHPY